MSLYVRRAFSCAGRQPEVRSALGLVRQQRGSSWGHEAWRALLDEPYEEESLVNSGARSFSWGAVARLVDPSFGLDAGAELKC